jgi:N-acetylmuramoyl-L-alanine amidase
VNGDTQSQDSGRRGMTCDQGDESSQRGSDHQGSAYSVQRSEHGITLRVLVVESCQSLALMRRLPLLVVLIVAVSACVNGNADPTRTNTEDSATTTDSPRTTTTTLPATTTSPSAVTVTTALPTGPPLAWVAPSGVPMAITGIDGDTVDVLTPCGDVAELTEGTPIYDVDVVIDPGHGGPIDTGAVAVTGLAEKEVNLNVGLAVQQTLTDRGISSMLTRTGDYPVPIPTRSDYADMVGARALVSIHHNSPGAPDSRIPGVEIFIQKDSEESRRLGGLLYESTMATLGRFDVEWDRASDAGVMTVLNPEGSDAYGMVRLPDTTSALIELGYIANPDEARLQATPAYAEMVGTSVADAIERFLTSEDTGSGFVDGRVFRPQRGVGADQCIEPDLDSALYPDVLEVGVSGGDGVYGFDVTLSSPYDTAQRYADAWRVLGEDGVVYGVRELTHDHATEQPFTRSLAGVEIPDSVESVVVEGRDQVYGWGGETVSVTLP